MANLMSRAANLRSYIIHVENWWDVILDFYGMKKTDYVLRCRNGIKCWAQPGSHDYGVVLEMLADKPYFPAIPGFAISEGDTVMDIGANTGVFSLVAALKGANVIAFEPSRRNYSMLRRNVELNSFQQSVKALKKAVSDKKGELKLFTSPHQTAHSIFKELAGDSGVSETVPATTLDSVMDEHNIESLDFLKIDCEGAEFAILKSTSKKTLQKIKRISMEYHEFDDNTGDGLAVFLEEQGFKVFRRPSIANLGHIFAWRGR